MDKKASRKRSTSVSTDGCQCVSVVDGHARTKRGFGKKEAKDHAKRLQTRGGGTELNVYRCPTSTAWHVGHSTGGRRGQI